MLAPGRRGLLDLDARLAHVLEEEEPALGRSTRGTSAGAASGAGLATA